MTRSPWHLVREFHEAFDLERPDRPTPPTSELSFRCVKDYAIGLLGAHHSTIKDEHDAVEPRVSCRNPVDDQCIPDFQIEADLFQYLTTACLKGRFVELRDATRNLQRRLVNRLEKQDPATLISDERAACDGLARKPSGDTRIEFLLWLPVSGQVFLANHMRH
ncbi:hypothetical protein GCM10029976_055300 [Kribbella albertanoniae]|nr:hypothetical protein [Kribbella albertanoniae]